MVAWRGLIGSDIKLKNVWCGTRRISELVRNHDHLRSLFWEISKAF